MSNKQLQKQFLDKKDYTPMYGIYQLKNESRLRDYRFTNYETLHKLGKKVERSNYNLVYAATMEDGKIGLDDIYMEFNLDHPDDFRGHSLSVSDVIVYEYGGNQYSAHYVDSFGFKPLPKFMSESGRASRRQSGAEM